MTFPFPAGITPAAAELNNMLYNFLVNFGDYDEVLTSQSTTTTASYVDLGTVGPAVTTTSVGTKALVLFACRSFVTTTAQGALMSVAVSGATTVAASDNWANVSTQNSSGSGQGALQFAWFTITPGSNTYTAKYKLAAGANAANFASRRMLVIAP